MYVLQLFHVSSLFFRDPGYCAESDEVTEYNGVTVAFQENGYFDSNSFIRFSDIIDSRAQKEGLNKIGEDGLEQFTLCMWISLNFLRGRKSTILSYSTDKSADSLSAGS